MKNIYIFQAIARQYFAQAYLLEQNSMFKAKSIVPFFRTIVRQQLSKLLHLNSIYLLMQMNQPSELLFVYTCLSH